nr:putative disease resistance rpp13-like protein 1 [Quercus suber]
MEFLLAGSVQELVVIAIIGICGVGKTTIAQLLYNDSKVEEHFELRAWAYVSEEFDVLNITRTIFKSVTPSECNVRDLNVLQVKLKQKLKRKRFLLVLDGIRNVNFSNWDLLSRPLSIGAYWRKIILTTRNHSVASIMHAVVTYPLPQFSFEACWSLFTKLAFNTRNPAEQPTLKRIGEEIVKKCKGLPLATETLGALLHSKVEAEEWHRILKSKIWDLPNDQKGFVQQQKGNDTIEEVGNEYFRELLSWSFFPCNKLFFVMRDLVNDLAQFPSGEFCCKFEDGKLHVISEKGRHFALSTNHLVDPEKFMTRIEVSSNLHSTKLFKSCSMLYLKQNDSGSRINELGRLSHLRSTLTISKLEYVVNAIDASKANLKSKNYLNKLVFQWNSDTHEVQTEIEVLDNLWPHENLKKLIIENYGGTRLPNWSGDAIFANMVFLHLSSNCNNLTPRKEWGLHEMVSLTCFEIEGGCNNVKFFPEEGLLPNTLTSLCISRLPNLKILDNVLQDLTSLETLEINDYEKPKSMPARGLPTTLTSLLITECLLPKGRCRKAQDFSHFWHTHFPDS